MTRKVYRSMMGKIVDMDLLTKANELTPAIGNAKMNARGDEIGPGGRIVKRRDEVVAEYYDKPNSVRDEQFKKHQTPEFKPETKETNKKTVTKKEAKNDDKEDKSNS